MTRPTVFDWIDTGLLVLRDVGAGGLTVERMCREMRRTKGAFYHHFPDVESFHGTVLARWSAAQTQAPIDAAVRAADGYAPALIGDRLREEIARLDHRLDRAVRAWALYDDTARRELKRVDAQRLAFLTQLHAAAGHEAPSDRALLEYGLFLGFQALEVAPETAERLRIRAFGAL
mgnify:CR=1 FL=1